MLVEIIGGGRLKIVPSRETFIVCCMDSEFDGDKNLLYNGRTDWTPFSPFATKSCASVPFGCMPFVRPPTCNSSENSWTDSVGLWCWSILPKFGSFS